MRAARERGRRAESPRHRPLRRMAAGARQGPQGAAGAAAGQGRRGARSIPRPARRGTRRTGGVSQLPQPAADRARPARHREVLRHLCEQRSVDPSAQLPPCLRHASAGGWGGSARHPGAARPCATLDDAEVHAGLARRPDGGLRQGASQGMNLRGEFRPMLRLAAPLALAELGWMAAGIADTVMAGPLGAAAVGAGSLGNMLFYPTATAASGLLLGMDTLVAQAFGGGDRADCRRTLESGVWIALGLSPVVMLIALAMPPAMRAAGTNPHVLTQFGPYVRALLWGVPPLLVYTALRRFLQAIDVVRPITFTLVSANLINI